MATKGKLNGEHENLPEEADPLFKLARLKMKNVQENITLCPCPLIIAIFVIYPGEALVMPGQLKATLTITDIESSNGRTENRDRKAIVLVTTRGTRIRILKIVRAKLKS